MTLTTQFYTMIAMVCMGGWLGAALDTYGRFLKRSTRANYIVFINDILFWVSQGLIIFYTLLVVNEGELRFYVFVAVLCGFAAYQSLLKSIYLRILERFIQAIIVIYQFLIRMGNLFIIKPIKMLFQLIIAILLGLVKIVLVIGNILLKFVLFLLKICFAPFKWIGILIWRIVPNSLKDILENIFFKCAGILRKIENMKHIFIKWWKKIRKL
ncbi:spore cortex biosynthesis protein YabQ [Ferdinandcohnia quinoae]|uniref:Spore cortex biosynthesis protein YabQ n=1 Tax=Fredinandcohnia quinoae TaxID=2918902 RepID=A0AAW5ECP0_9BACI|nr:spore cortex biosynthesis protein YabQ [Fredinandcohnia sp. SECRCQ15]MCH1626928.1 spore cortex biosynthesis protein YabQ [Fredinandcohnia sp. SECRCQ15]